MNSNTCTLIYDASVCLCIVSAVCFFCLFGENIIEFVSKGNGDGTIGNESRTFFNKFKWKGESLKKISSDRNHFDHRGISSGSA